MNFLRKHWVDVGTGLSLLLGLWNGQGFDANSGRIIHSTAQANAPLVSGLNFPNSIKRTSSTTYYIAQTFDGTIRKIDF